MAQYELAGVSGSALSTLQLRSAAKICFEEFLITKELPKRDLLSACQISIILIQEFGTYLILHAHKQVGDMKQIMSGTALNYLSQTILFFRIKFKNLKFLEKDENWQYLLRSDIEKRIDNRQMHNGEPVSEKSRAIGRKLLKVRLVFIN